jgi:hypothetical protein
VSRAPDDVEYELVAERDQGDEQWSAKFGSIRDVQRVLPLPDDSRMFWVSIPFLNHRSTAVILRLWISRKLKHGRRKGSVC